MKPRSDRYHQAVKRIDAANARDPHDKEVLYAQRMTERLEQFAPEASEALCLAARAQHIRRWEVPRKRYPMDRKGYHQWRTGLYTFHADAAEAILREVGYEDAAIEQVRGLLMKKRLKTDPQMQTLEDVACLVFLEHYFDAFSTEHDQAKLVQILQRTWRKMSERGHEAALALPLSAEAKRLVGLALAQAE
ncbi:MAG: DUF4202 domain-containing protein [Phycisphaerae bacterium]|nr:DUF4202 domain-containing protein [Phycisphaerae bacterium]